MTREGAESMRVIHLLIFAVLTMALVAGCASRKEMYKGDTTERVEEFSAIDDTLEEKHLEESGATEFIK